MNPNGEITSQLQPNGVRQITFGHPAHNSFPSSQLKAAVAAIDTAGDDPETSCIVFRSQGDRTFCAGANLDELLAIDNPAQAKEFFLGFARLILAMKNCPKPIVVAVQGKAIGGGVGIAAAADYCLATEAAAIKLSELSIAIGPFVILPALVRKMGVAAASEMSLDTEWHSAKWAHQNGLYQRLLPDVKSLHQATDELAGKLAGHSQLAAAKLKETLWFGTEHWPQVLDERAEVSGGLVLSAPAKAALARFKTKD
ncbi:enoyl-CoA hydratase/isomerase family protein [Neolewinella antarctica]|uniref:Methylglutaconyl-CoA hydratase n=1 Tax=Neolewinella antarctica TaxID=442734 RepID=A0ABX0XE58_9BACT|nr:enoyl-CoA hydratase/isomerase family protein [Neolewinella antarctica]NJC27179.1 methylglutaconyl-CoA hydratase [Neolewinella antarctica]